MVEILTVSNSDCETMASGQTGGTIKFKGFFSFLPYDEFHLLDPMGSKSEGYPKKLGFLTSKEAEEAQKIYLWEGEAKPVPTYNRLSSLKLNPLCQHIYFFSHILDTFQTEV